MTKVLVYAQDPGGAQNIAMVAKRLLEKGRADMAIIVHPLAKAVFEEFRLPFQSIAEQGLSLPLNEKRAEDFLASGSFTHVFCGTSNPRYDPTNSNIIEAARKLGLPSFGFIEHWKGWDRFYDDGGKLAYVPDILGCIDSFSAKKLEQVSIPEHQLVVVGHPYLEWIYLQKQAGVFRSRNESSNKIVLVSQPLVNRNFESIFGVSTGSMSLADGIGNMLSRLRKTSDFVAFYRPHPKEKTFAGLPEGIILDRQPRWIDVLKDADIIVGLDSMALIEAFFAGKWCISLKLPELENVSDMNCPFQFSVTVRSLQGLKKTLSRALAGDKGIFPQLEDHKNLVEGSTERCVRAFNEFIDANS